MPSRAFAVDCPYEPSVAHHGCALASLRPRATRGTSLPIGLVRNTNPNNLGLRPLVQLEKSANATEDDVELAATIEEAVEDASSNAPRSPASAHAMKANRMQYEAAMRALITQGGTASAGPTSSAAPERLATGLRKGFAQDTAQMAKTNPAGFAALSQQAFGDKGQDLLAKAQNGSLPQPANIRFVDRETLKGSDGAYSPKDGGTVYLAKDLKSDPEALQRTYNEEAAHHLDHALGGPDAAGDEGQIFAEGLAKGGPLGAAELAAARADRDKSTIFVDGEAVEVENAWFSLRAGDIFNLATSAASFIPGAGDAIAIGSAAVNFATGNYPAALFDLISIIPGLGDTIGIAGKLLLQNRLPRALAAELAEGLVKHGPKLKEGIEASLRAAERSGLLSSSQVRDIIRGLDEQIEAAVQMARRTAGQADEVATLSRTAQRSVRSLRRRIAEHRQKLNDYIANPDAFDHRGILKNASPERRRSIIEGRVRHLRQEIETFERQVEDLIRGG